MGHRANFVLVDESGWRLHYSHWAAREVCSALIAGPAAATRYISAQLLCTNRESDWLDDVWAEGGAVVDHVTRRVVFYGDELMADLSTKRAFLRLLPLTWPGWTVVWAYDGIGDLAAEVGVDRVVVRRIDEDDLQMPELENPGESWCHLLTVKDESGTVTAYPFRWESNTAWQGPELLDRLPPGGLPHLDLDELPASGLHVDVAARTAALWIHESAGGLVPALPTLWPGWHTEFWKDHVEEQLTRCQDTLTCPPVDLTRGLDNILKTIPKRFGHDPVPAMLKTVERHRQDSMKSGGKGKVELNPNFTTHTPVSPTPEEWSKVVEAADSLGPHLT